MSATGQNLQERPMQRSLELSVIVPAYNESLRLPPVLGQMRTYLDTHFHDSYEVIVVDDGSDDCLLDFLEALSASWRQLVIVRHLSNLGKGAAVKSGMAHARGDLWLYADADGATPISEETRLREAILCGADMAIGSRTFTSGDARRFRCTGRQLLSWLFSRICRVALHLPVLDTQCGFKMFRREVGEWLFTQLNETGFAFDLELLTFASLARYRVAEVPVSWYEMPGTTVRLVRDSRRMLGSVFAIRQRRQGLLRTNEPYEPKGETLAAHYGSFYKGLRRNLWVKTR